LTGTGLEDVSEGQSVLGGLTANNTRNKVAEYFLRDAGAASYSRCQKYEQWSTKSKKKNMFV
jgi:hypothetical protein